MIAFAHASGDVRSLLGVLRGTLGGRNVTTIKRAAAAGWHRPGATIVKLEGDAGAIQSAVDAAMGSGGRVTIFQQHATFVPGGPVARRDKE